MPRYCGQQQAQGGPQIGLSRWGSWGSQHRGAAMGAGDLAKIAVEHGLLLGVIGDGNEISRARRLGVAIQSRRGRVTRVGDVGVRIEPETGAKGRPLWRPVKDAQVHAFKTG